MGQGISITNFHSLYSHGFARVSVCVPRLKVSDPAFNVARTIDLARAAAKDSAAIAVFPELGLSGYSNDDLFQQDALLERSLGALQELFDATRDLPTVLAVGLPLQIEQRLFNCAVLLHQGRVLGVVPKTYLPNYREFYEKRQFTSATTATTNMTRLLGADVPFGTDLIFEAEDLPSFSIFTEICEDVWSPIPPSTFGALAGATVLVNLSASNITVGKAAYRRQLCTLHSGRCISAYLYTAAGQGESTTDLAWDGHAMICENANVLNESQRFADHEQILTADVDLDRLRQERMRLSSFIDTAAHYAPQLAKMRRVGFRLGIGSKPVALRRAIERFPFVPDNAAERDERCFETYSIQVSALAQRLASSGINKLVIGVSGGLDSTHALVICCRTMDQLKLPRTNVLAYTMPGFATSEGTKSSAWKLMQALGVSAAEIDIRPSCLQMLRDLDHPFARGEKVYDITFENVQAGERTSHLFRLANHHRAMVIGTGDLSELALGWMTYGVGDHMSHYAVNASIPKTLIQHLIRWEMSRSEPQARQVLSDILETEISPELIPHDNAGADKPGGIQKTQDSVGPYELQDFNLYYITRFGYRPSKVAFLALTAWGDAQKGLWPPGFPESKRNGYTLAEVRKWLAIFLHRFFATSQFKRSAIPNGPKVGSGGSLSPRGDWRAPSDSSAITWIDELERNVPGE